MGNSHTERADARQRPGRAAKRIGVLILLAFLGQCLAVIGAAAAPARQGGDPADKVEDGLTAELDRKDEAEFLVYFSDRASLASASGIADWKARGDAVVAALQGVADRSQAKARAELDAAGVDYTAYWVANAIHVKAGNEALIASLAEDPEVRAIQANHLHALPAPTAGTEEALIDAVEWGIANIGADDVWSTFGVRGEGIVVANIDTGVDFDHPALVSQYRGNLGNGTFDHNYNWVDPSSVCGSPSLAPCDNNNHGTHTMGTMAGYDGGANQIGVAPNVQWIAAKGCESNSCSDAALLGSGQWIVAPTDLSGANPRTEMRPHIVNNSWGGGGGDLWYQATVDAWIAAGIFPAFSNGNSGPACNTAGSPGDYVQSYASGAYDIDNVIAGFSSRGPGVGGEIKPNLAAPGVNIRSSVNGGGYAAFNGTSMASPHTAGTVALMWSAAPTLVGDIDETRALLDDNATDVNSIGCGGSVDDNNNFGEGRLDALRSVQQSPRGPVGTLQGFVTDASNGQPIAGAAVTVTGPVSRNLVTNSDGRYEVPLSVGDYEVTAAKFGYVSQTINVTITEGDTVSGNIQLTPAPSGSISGLVLTDDGTPIESATVTVAGTPLTPATTDADGAYSFPAVPHGTYSVTASTGVCYQSETQSVTVDGAEAADFELSGASDSFGYACSVEPTGYTEATTPVSLTGDDAAASVALPFPFLYYGQAYSTAFLSTNGHVNFLASSTAFSNVAIPNTATPNAAIYPFWDDLLLDSSSRVFTATRGAAPDREFVIEYRNAGFFGDSTLRVDFEVVLGEGDDIAFHYRNLGPAAGELGNSATVGIENRTGTVGLQMSFNQASLSNARSIRFHAPPSGRLVGMVTDANDALAVAGATVTARQGSSVVASTTTAADGTYAIPLLVGTYDVVTAKTNYATESASITIGSDGAVVTHDVVLRTARAASDRSAVSFVTSDDELLVSPLTVLSTGTLDLTFDVDDDAQWLAIVPDGGTLAPGASRSLRVFADPSGLSVGSYAATITITTNAGRIPVLTIPVSLVVTDYQVAIDSGGKGLTDSAGNVWVADRKWTAGSYGYVKGKDKKSSAPIAGTVDDVLYQTQRHELEAYRFDSLPAGTYVVELLFAELDNGVNPGERRFDVSINGTVLLDDYDIAAAVGRNTADVRQGAVTVAGGGSILVEFDKADHSKQPAVNAIRVTRLP